MSIFESIRGCYIRVEGRAKPMCHIAFTPLALIFWCAPFAERIVKSSVKMDNESSQLTVNSDLRQRESDSQSASSEDMDTTTEAQPPRALMPILALVDVALVKAYDGIRPADEAHVNLP